MSMKKYPLPVNARVVRQERRDSSKMFFILSKKMDRQSRRVLLLLSALIAVFLVKTLVLNKEIKNITMVNGNLILSSGSLHAYSANQRGEKKADHDGGYRFQSYCSSSADRRGPHQKVIAYSLYGDFTDSTIFTRYVEPLKMILQNITKVYPGI